MHAANPHVLVGLSGGVDSAVTALLLKEQGYQVEGVFMKNWEADEDQTDPPCSLSQDRTDAEAVCEKLVIPFTTVNFSDQYWEKVFTHFLADCRAGLTPNPDVLCNREIKFRAFLAWARNRGADCIATGHYARIIPGEHGPVLLKGTDSSKDQSYFLHLLSREQLAHSLFPLGNLHKTTVRQLARRAGLPVHAKRDSTGICFIGEKRFRHFLSAYLQDRKGPIETPEGHCLGEHHGLMYYTIGQRQGIGIGGQKAASGMPWYVARKEVQRNALIVVQGTSHPLLKADGLIATDVHWIGGIPPSFPLRAFAKTRYRQQDAACIIVQTAPDTCEVQFSAPQHAIAPGQSVVFYQQDTCLGGGRIAGTMQG